jgi:hypothetical protein
MKLIINIFIIAGFICQIAVSQENKPFTLNGYVSTMQSIMFDSVKGTFTNENLIHNRLNFKGYAGKNISFAVELRNRLYTGDNVESTDGYADLIGTDEGLIDLSWNIVNENSILLNTAIDRYWVDLNYGKFQARIGRQRINWGQTFVWNPNDIFNTYSFFDVDYIERPGSDAVRLQYYPGSSSALEFAIKANNDKDITTAVLYRFNRWGYDIQFLTGYVNGEDYVAGTGWSGAFGSISFRGEASWFQPVKHFSDSTGRGLFTVGFDKAFKDNSMVQLQFMYCNDPVDFSSFGTFYTGNLSSKDLAFSKFTAFGQFSIPATPLLNLSFSAMWFPDLKGCFLGPSCDYSLAENIDLSLFWQYFQSTLNGTSTRINLGFLRLKYSF